MTDILWKLRVISWSNKSSQLANFANAFIPFPANIYLFKLNNRNKKKVWNMFNINIKDTRTTSQRFNC